MKRPNLVGIDVSESSIKVLELNSEYEIVAYGSALLKEGIVANGLIKDKAQFAATLNEILTHTKPHTLDSKGTTLRAVLSLSESKLFTHHIPLPVTLKKSDIAEYVRSEAEKIIPFNLIELYWDYHTIDTNGLRYATFVGAPKTNIDNYVEAFTDADVKPAIIGSELLALGRALLLDTLSALEATIILDIGAHVTTIGVFRIDAVADMSVTVPFGGNSFTNLISQRLSVSLEEAERQKRAYGFDAKHKNNKARAVLEECVGRIAQNIKEVSTYYESVHTCPIKHIIVAGGSALIPELCPYLEKSVGIETRIANPIIKIKKNSLFESGTPTLFFANVVGLGLLGTDTDIAGINLLNQYRYADDDTEKEGLNIRDIRSVSDVKYFIYGFIRTGHRSMSAVSGVIRPMLIHIELKLVFAVILVAVALAGLVWVILLYT